MKRHSKLVLVSLLLALLLAACSSSDPVDNGTENEGETSNKEQILIFANDQEPAGLDPHKVPAHSSIRIYEKIYNSLVRLDENMDVQPELAIKWEQPDDTTYIFTLKEGVKFHNGREMTAEDVKYSFERILDEETASIARSYFTSIEEINVLDPYTVEFKLSQVYAPFLSYVASVNAAIVPQEVVEEHGDLMQVAVGTGPFKFTEWVPDTHVKLVKNEEYHQEGTPKLDGLTYMTMKDESSRMAAVRTGQVHVTTLSSQSIPLVKDNDRLDVKSYQSREYSYLGFNLNKEPFHDERVRQAISLAVDREEIIDMVWNGDAVVSGPVPSSLGKWAIDVTKEEMYQLDVEKAKALLAEAGYPDGFQTVISTASTYPDMIETAQILQQQLGQIGIMATIEQLEWGQYIDAWTNGTHDMLVGRNGAGSDPDRALGFFFASTGSANVWGFEDEGYDQLINEGRVTTDDEERLAIYLEAQKKLIHTSPNLFLSSPVNYFVANKDVEGFTPKANHPENFLQTTIK